MDEELRMKRDAAPAQTTTPTTASTTPPPPAPLTVPIGNNRVGPSFAPGELTAPPPRQNASLLPAGGPPPLAAAAAAPPIRPAPAYEAAGQALDQATAAVNTPTLMQRKADPGYEALVRARAAARDAYHTALGVNAQPVTGQTLTGQFTSVPLPGATPAATPAAGATKPLTPGQIAVQDSPAPVPSVADASNARVGAIVGPAPEAVKPTATPAAAAPAPAPLATAPAVAPPMELSAAGTPGGGTATIGGTNYTVAGNGQVIRQGRPSPTGGVVPEAPGRPGVAAQDVSGGTVVRNDVRVPRNVSGPAPATTALAPTPSSGVSAVPPPALSPGSGSSAGVSAALEAAAARGDWTAIQKHYQDQQGGTYMGKEAWQEKPDLSTPAARRAFAAQQKQVEATRLGTESATRMKTETGAEARRGRESTARIAREDTAEARAGRESAAKIEDITGRRAIAMNADQRAQGEEAFKQAQHNASLRLLQGGLSPEEEQRLGRFIGAPDKYKTQLLKGELGSADSFVMYDTNSGHMVNNLGQEVYPGHGKASTAAPQRTIPKAEWDKFLKDRKMSPAAATQYMKDNGITVK